MRRSMEKASRTRVVAEPRRPWEVEAMAFTVAAKADRKLAKERKAQRSRGGEAEVKERPDLGRSVEDDVRGGALWRSNGAWWFSRWTRRLWPEEEDEGEPNRSHG